MWVRNAKVLRDALGKIPPSVSRVLLTQKSLPGSLRRVIILLGVLDLLCVLAVQFRINLSDMLREIAPNYASRYTQSAKIGDLTMVLYGPEMLGDEQTRPGMVWLYNEGTAILKDIVVSLRATNDGVMFATKDTASSNEIRIEQLDPGSARAAAIDIITGELQAGQAPIEVNTYAQYDLVATGPERVFGDLELIVLKGQTSARTISVPDSQTPSDILLHVALNSDANNDAAAEDPIELALISQALQPAVKDVTITIYPEEETARFQALPVDSESNIVQIPSLQLFEIRTSLFRLHRPENATAPLHLNAHVEYSVNRSAPVKKTAQAPNALKFGISRYQWLYGGRSRLGGAIESAAPSWTAFSASVGSLLAAFVALAGSFTLIIKNAGLMLRWIRAGRQQS